MTRPVQHPPRDGAGFAPIATAMTTGRCVGRFWGPELFLEVEVISSETVRSDDAYSTVTFTLTDPGSQPISGQRVSVVGDFNEWDPTATPMQTRGGVATATIALPPGRYRFRYLTQDGEWFNDEAADDYVSNDHGGQDAILDLTRHFLEGDQGHSAADGDTDGDAGAAMQQDTGAEVEQDADATGDPFESELEIAVELETALEQDRRVGEDLAAQAGPVADAKDAPALR